MRTKRTKSGPPKGYKKEGEHNSNCILLHVTVDFRNKKSERFLVCQDTLLTVEPDEKVRRLTFKIPRLQP